MNDERASDKAGRREWLGLMVIALPCLLYAMDLTVLNLARAKESACRPRPQPPKAGPGREEVRDHQPNFQGTCDGCGCLT